MQGKGQWLFCLWLISPEAIQILAFTSQKKLIFVEVYSLKAKLFRSIYLKDCQDFLRKKKLLIFGNLFFFMEEKKKIKFETSSGFCTTIIIQEIMVKKKKSYLLCIYLISYYVPYYVFIIK